MHTEEYAKMRSLEDRYWWFVSRRRLATSLLNQFCPEARVVLDLGCGTGALLAELQGRMPAIGLDFSDDALQFCRERGLTNVVQGDAQAIGVVSNSFDAVISLDTLEHVPNDTKALKEIERVLRPGGVLVLNVPAFKWLWGPHDVALMHFRRYTRKQLRSVLEGAGLKVEHLSYSVFFLFPLVVLTRMLEKLRKGAAEVRLPGVPNFINKALVILQDMETGLLLKCPLPWGSSVVAVARKPH